MRRLMRFILLGRTALLLPSIPVSLLLLAEAVKNKSTKLLNQLLNSGHEGCPRSKASHWDLALKKIYPINRTASIIVSVLFAFEVWLCKGFLTRKVKLERLTCEYKS